VQSGLPVTERPAASCFAGASIEKKPTEREEKEAKAPGGKGLKRPSGPEKERGLLNRHQPCH